MANILPGATVSTNTITVNTVQSTKKEYAWDFDKDDFIMENGRPKLVSGVEAIKVWIYKALKTARYRFLAYTDDFGIELGNLIGSILSQDAFSSEAERMVKECLYVHPDILNIKDFSITRNENVYSMEFTVDTTFGTTIISL